MKIVMPIIGLLIPFFLGFYPVSLTFSYFALLALIILLSLAFYRKHLIPLSILLGFGALGVLVYNKSVEMKLTRIAKALDNYKSENEGYPESLSNIGLKAPAYYSKTPKFHSTSNYFVFKYESKGVFANSFGFTSAERKLGGSKKQGWDG